MYKYRSNLKNQVREKQEAEPKGKVELNCQLLIDN